ncbi:50S ribosome-binding GTPase [Candidatus Peregrinibacteria bacterium]|nr:50S ribosome-binding GTPase [Candidatus Peregrinibacteria bacterium]
MPAIIALVMQPIIAIIGRPNVGKSTLFNRLIGKKLSITSPVAGTTRDRVYHEAEVDGYGVILADTGGMEFEKKSDIEADVQTQARIAAQEADLVYFVVDGSAPLTSTDIDVAQYLRASGKAIMLIAHKADKRISAEIFPELYRLGLGEPAAVSSRYLRA